MNSVVRKALCHLVNYTMGKSSTCLPVFFCSVMTACLEDRSTERICVLLVQAVTRCAAAWLTLHDLYWSCCVLWCILSSSHFRFSSVITPFV